MIIISNIIGKLNRRSRFKRKSQPKLVNRPPGTFKTVAVTVVCVIAFFYVLGVLFGGKTSEGEEITAGNYPVSAKIYYGDLELPVTGASGYALVKMNMTAAASLPLETVKELEPGTAFLILREEGDHWEVLADGVTGWVRHSACMINLPDVVPSIKYNGTNTYSSLLTSGGEEIPGVTGQALYEGRGFNERLGEDEFIIPVMYAMAKRICQAQRNALTNGDSLVVYESFRPYAAQRRVAEALEKLAPKDREARESFNFISSGVSNHQLGVAVDVTLAKIIKDKYSVAGPYQYLRVDECTEYEMPSLMHDLSAASQTFPSPAGDSTTAAWESTALSPGIMDNEPARKLKKYCADAGLTSDSAKWWEFNDLSAIKNSPENSRGEFFITDCYSVFPDN